MNGRMYTCVVLGTLLGTFAPVPLFGDNSSPPLAKAFRTIRADGQTEAYSHGEFGFPFGSRRIAFSSSGRWIAFPYLEGVALGSDTGAATRGDTRYWTMGVFNLRDADAGPRRWRMGAARTRSRDPAFLDALSFDSNGPVFAGPDDTFLFPVEEPFPDAVDILPPIDGLTREQQRAKGIPDTELLADYIRIAWCRTEKTAYYRLPHQWGEGSPRHRWPILISDLWVSDNPVTKKRSLFGLWVDGTLCFWELQNGGKPPAANILRVDELPRTLNLFDLFKGARESPTSGSNEEDSLALLAAAGTQSLLAATRDRRIVLLPLATGKAYALDSPQDISDDVYKDLLLSANGAVCVASRAARPPRRAERIDVKEGQAATTPTSRPPNVLAAWSAASGKLLWEKKLSDTLFISRAALHPEGTLLVTWSCPETGQQKTSTPAEDAQRQKEARFRRGILHVWDIPTGKILATRSFPLSTWPHGISFTADGASLAILETGGTCHLIETAKLTSAP